MRVVDVRFGVRTFDSLVIKLTCVFVLWLLGIGHEERGIALELLSCWQCSVVEQREGRVRVVQLVSWLKKDSVARNVLDYEFEMFVDLAYNDVERDYSQFI